MSVAGHPQLPRGHIAYCGTADTPLETLLLGPATSTLGDTNVFGALRRAMAKTGYSDLKEFQKVGLPFSLISVGKRPLSGTFRPKSV